MREWLARRIDTNYRGHKCGANKTETNPDTDSEVTAKSFLHVLSVQALPQNRGQSAQYTMSLM